MEQNLRLTDPRRIKKFNDTIHTRIGKDDIYQKINYIHNRDIYPLPTPLSHDFEILEKLITHLMHVADKKPEEK